MVLIKNDHVYTNTNRTMKTDTQMFTTPKP